jgi:hypothetical protein
MVRAFECSFKTGGHPMDFSSKLTIPKEKFLATFIVLSLELGERHPKSFIKHFSPAKIMAALKDHPNKRAGILTPTIGVNEKVALKKSPASAGEDLQIALDEDATDEESIVSVFHPDDRVRHLELTELWDYVTEGRFWDLKKDGKDPEAYKRAQKLVSFCLSFGLELKLMSPLDVVEGISHLRLAQTLPPEEVAKLFAAALSSEKKFDEPHFVKTVPPDVLVEHVPLNEIWHRVIEDRLAKVHGLLKKEEPPPETKHEGGRSKPPSSPPATVAPGGDEAPASPKG